MKPIFSLLLACISWNTFAQSCDCEKELVYLKGFIETNYAGFADKEARIGKGTYTKKVLQLKALARNATSENCLLVLSKYIDLFKDQHIQLSARFNPTQLDSSYISQRSVVEVSPKKLATLQTSTGIEGVYHFTHDTSYTIAVLKDPSPLHDYVGVTIDSRLPSWKRGHVKFEAWRVNDSLYKGVLYVRNHRPKTEWFYMDRNTIGGDWQRVGTPKVPWVYNYEPVASKQLNDKTLYLKIGSFSPSNAKNIDSLLKAHQSDLESKPYLLLDLRGNGGGADFTYAPLLPYLYTGPIKTIGVDVLATESNIKGWQKVLDNPDLPESSKQSIRNSVAQMEANKGRLVNVADDFTDSSFSHKAYPQKIVILIDKGCASTTEQFLLAARQSSKVTLAGESTEGVLDYSNMREAALSCMPYVLRYATTRSRRLDVGQGIDNVGIQPNVHLKKGGDWVQEAVKLMDRSLSALSRD